jgi:Fe-Mn family superoxide dismutase
MSQLARRQFLATAGAGVATLALAPLSFRDAQAARPKGAAFELPKLPYAYDALEPVIDKQTMMIHHTKHHQAYINGLNDAIKKAPVLAGKTLVEIVSNPMLAPAAVRRQVINMGGGDSNHRIFWRIMGPKGGGKPGGALAKAIDKAFKNFETFQKNFSQAAATQFGSGWAWLVLNAKKELEIVQRPNQNSPYMDGLKPVFGIDVWEHAYYLKYKNDRGKYIAEWWKVVNWTAVGARYDQFMRA